jgi:hypothetical protein
MAPQNYRQNNSGVGNFTNKLQPGLIFIGMIFVALIAFEIFNYSTTEHALNDLLGELTFIGLPWSTVLAIAFCGIDFAGIARLFTPETGSNEPKEVWYLIGAWLLAATMNAILTWWGVSMAIASHKVAPGSALDAQTISSVVPIFVAIMVWVIRVLIIGTLSFSMDHMLHPDAIQRPMIQTAFNQHQAYANNTAARGTGERAYQPANASYQETNNGNSFYQNNGQARPVQNRPAAATRSAAPTPGNNTTARFSSYPAQPQAVSKQAEEPAQSSYARPEPVYHSLSASGPRSSGDGGVRR